MRSDIYADGRYATDNPTYHVEDSAWKASQVYEVLSQRRLSPKTVVEVGCGAGEVLVQLQRLLPGVTRLEGWDVSPQAIRLAEERSTERLTFHEGDMLAQSGDRFDLGLCLDVVEHVEDYIGFLRAFRSHAEWKVFHIPLELSVQSIFRVTPIVRERARVGHLHHFTKETALATLNQAGYEVTVWRYTAGALDLPDKSVLQLAARTPRRLLRAFNPDVAARWLGGFSLVVLAR
jgi:SAM-dependent methyltransferase